jgi:hypothetical protein
MKKIIYMGTTNHIDMKAMAAMEMIVIMVILLVVAGVVINMFMSTVNTNVLPTMDPVQERKQAIVRECQPLCSDYKSGNMASGVGYCSKKFVADLTGNGNKKSSFNPGAALGIIACEDAIYCPLIYTCELSGGGTLGLTECKQLLCDSIKTTYMSIGVSDEEASTKASAEVLGLIKSGSCVTPTGKTHWYDPLYRKAKPVCP